MRVTRLRAGLAAVLGMTLIGIATPAWATPSDLHPTTPPPTDAPGIQLPDLDEDTNPHPDTGDTSQTGSPSASPSAAGADAVHGDGVAPAESPTSSPTPAAVGGEAPGPQPAAAPPGEPLDELRAFMASAGIFFPDTDELGAEDFVVNPLALTYTCTPDGTHWKLANNGPDPLGVGWFDTNLGGSFIAISAGQTVDLPSKALAVIAHPVDSEGNVLVTVPTVGVSSCEGAAAGGVAAGAGAGAGAGPGAAAVPAALPAAGPATPVKADPYYTG